MRVSRVSCRVVSRADVPNTLNGLNDGFAVWPAAALSPQIQAGNVLREKPDGEQVLVELDFNALLTTLLDFAPQLVGTPGPNSTGGLYTLALGTYPRVSCACAVCACALVSCSPRLTVNVFAKAPMQPGGLWWGWARWPSTPTRPISARARVP
jgi:hypothetical protein